MATWLNHIPSLSDNPTHPAQVALRTYALALSLSLGPSLIPFATTLVVRRKSSRTNLSALWRILRRELGHDGFAFAITVSVGGGAALRHLWNGLHTSADVSTDFSSPTSIPIVDKGRWGEDERGAQHRVVQTSIASLVKKWAKNVDLSPEQRTFLANIVTSSMGIFLLQEGRERTRRLAEVHSANVKRGDVDMVSPTLDLALLLVVRALDSLVQLFIHARSGKGKHGAKESGKLTVKRQCHLTAEPDLVKDLLEKERRRRNHAFREKLSMRIDALLFWACSARIMWCFFYEPQRLPRSYVKWINTLANVDARLLKTLNLLRERKWMYRNSNPAYVDYLKPYAKDLGRPTSWADPLILPAYGGPLADTVWRTLNVASRPGVGGLPCELVHAEVGSSLGLSHSCLANTGLRGAKAFVEAIAIYIPAHFLPVLMTRPQTLFRPHRFLQTLLAALRSATFLSAFVASYWFAVCFTRSLVLAKYLPFISHNFWDGPLGCMLAGSLLCGSSIWIENGKRRGEMALYVMPKALRACLPDNWVKVGSRRARIVERVIIIFSISSLLTAAVHRPESLRGLSRWTLSFIMNGPNAGFWKRKRRDPSIPPTPSFPPTSANPSVDRTPPDNLSRPETPNSIKYPRI